MSVRERLKILRHTLNANQQDFARGIFISKSYYACIESGHKEINDRILNLLEKVYNVNKNWLLTGLGEVFNAGSPPNIKLEELIGIFKRLNSHFQEYILDQIRGLEKIQKRELDQNKPPKLPSTLRG